MNEREREQVDQIATSIRSSRQLETILGTYDFEDATIGEVATSAVDSMIEDQLTSLGASVVAELQENEAYRTESLTKLGTLRDSLLDLKLSTDEIDQRIQEFNDLANENDALIIEFIATKGVARAIAESPDEVEVSDSHASLEQNEIFEADSESVGRLIRLGFEVHADRPSLLIGSRRIKLSGANGQQKDYSPERMAAVAVLADLMPGSELRVSALWKKLNAKLGVSEDYDFDRDTMNQVRGFITSLHYRNQPIFYHNEVRGIASAYGVNPELKYDVAFSADDDEVTAFIRELHSARMQAKPTPIVIIDEASDIPVTTMFVPDQVYQAEIPQVEVENPVTEILEMPESRLDETIMPNPLELHVFLSKLHSSINILQGSLGTIDQNSMIARLSEITDETLEYYEADYTPEQKEGVVTDAAIEEVRRRVTEKIIALTEDNELLNNLLEGDVEKRLEDVYGSHIGVQVMKLIETVLDMDEDEKATLRKLIEARPGMSITVDEGSYTAGVQIIDVDFHLGGHELSDGVSNNTDLQMSDEAAVEPDVVGELIETQLEEMSELSRQANEPEQPNITVEVADEAFEQASVVNTGNAVKKIIRQEVGAVVEQLQAVGFAPDSTFSVGQLAMVLGLRVRDIVNARENNLIGENKGQSLTFEDVALILAANSNNPELKKVFQNNTKRKQFKKQLRQTIDLLS